MVKSFARFSTFQRGRIIGQAEIGASRKHIRKTCRETDGKQAGMRVIESIIADRDDPDYDGSGAGPMVFRIGGALPGHGLLQGSLRVICGSVCA